MWRIPSLLFLAVLSLACIHPPKDYPGKLGSKVQEYLFFATGDEIHLVMNQRVQSDRPLPGMLAWVVPLPAVPTAYFQERDSLFETLFRATEPRMRGGGPVSLSATIQVHGTVHVGAYEIVPIEVRDTAAGKDVNAWLEANGFRTVPPAGLRYYLKPKACFLAIKVRALSGNENVLHPLHVVYRATEARVPLKFFANAGVFDAYVYLPIRADSVPDQAGLKAAGFSVTGGAALDSALRAGLGLKGLPGDSRMFQRYLAKNLNTPGNPLSGWREDPQVLFKPQRPQ
jgi:hypothetical protein